MKRVAITGAAGSVAGLVRSHLAQRYDLILTDRKRVRPTHERERFVRADLRSGRALRRVLSGSDALIHLGGIPREDRFERLLENNVRATQIVLDAARAQGIRRVVLASTGHVTGFYSRREVIDGQSAVRPDTLYAVSKAACEALGRYYADKFGMEICCVRIGHVSEVPEYPIDRSIWCSARDLASLLAAALETPSLHFEIVYGVSDNSRAWWCSERARSLGFTPADSADRYNLGQSALAPVGELVQGAEYAARDFCGDIRRFA